jgi:hypothetical protein
VPFIHDGQGADMLAAFERSLLCNDRPIVL